MQDNLLLLDGGMGSLLYARGMSRTERSEQWALTHPEIVKEIHRSYYDAGSNMVLSNTFGANGLFHSSDELREIVRSAVRLVREAAEESGAPQRKFAALDIGPCGKIIKPLGDFHFDQALELFAELVRNGSFAAHDAKAALHEAYPVDSAEEALLGDADVIGADEAASFIAQIKEEIVKQGLDDRDSMRAFIKDFAERNNIALNDSQLDQITDLAMRFVALDIDPKQLSDQIRNFAGMLDQLGKAAEKTAGFFESFGKAFRDFFQWIADLFGGNN